MPTSQTWSYTSSHIDANIPDVVLHVITYRCQCPRRGLTRTHIYHFNHALSKCQNACFIS
ncbi:hypothetical protein F383_37078 [Gossypium arboreum]|uniref:Uncharacterized protein n=1 Tax=Gossypium arboreum TaxID=29729 RepID=A0A0B0MFZ2_GOSAR|nr:hypothetical protein F383_37078 [Gossypium arboreum]